MARNHRGMTWILLGAAALSVCAAVLLQRPSTPRARRPASPVHDGAGVVVASVHVPAAAPFVARDGRIHSVGRAHAPSSTTPACSSPAPPPASATSSSGRPPRASDREYVAETGAPALAAVAAIREAMGR
jgi:Flp pilus assembly protein CpaB